MSSGFAFKQALVVRMDLKMGRGKIAVQCAHAAIGAARETRAVHPDWWKTWIEEGQAKIALKIPDLETMNILIKEAGTRGIPYYVVEDRGLTQVPPGSITCLGLGPAPSRVLDPLTGDLPLL